MVFLILTVDRLTITQYAYLFDFNFSINTILICTILSTNKTSGMLINAHFNDSI